MTGKEYLYFTKKERNGITALILILLTVMFLPRLIWKKQAVARSSETMVETIDQMPSQVSDVQGGMQVYNENANGKKYPDKPIPPVKNRQHAGGSSYTNNKSTIRWKKNLLVEINGADTTQFIALPAIGSKLAARVVAFREKLGGFYSVEQLREVYGIQDSTFMIFLPFVRCDTSLIRKIHINTAGKELMQTHPYIRWQFAQAIVNYRNHHGPFSSADDIASIHGADSNMLKKIKPYLLFD